MPALPLHPAISNSDAAAILGAGVPPGKYLLRKRPGSATDYVLSVTFGGKVTHHKISPNASGDLCVNGKSYGNAAKTLDDFIPQLAADPPPAGWPVRLEQAFPPATGGAGGGAGGGAPEDIKNIKAWVHDAMSNAKSEALFKAASTSGEGVFMVRRRGTEFPKGFVLSVVYKGKPSHHLIHVAPEKSKINKATLKGASSVHDVIRALRKKHKFWPVALKDAILPDIAGEKKAAEEAAKARAAKAAKAAAAKDASAADAAAADASAEADAAAADASAEADAAAAEEARSAEAAAAAAATATTASTPARQESVQMQTFQDPEDGGTIGFGDSDGDSDGEGSAPAAPAVAGSGSGGSSAATHDAELATLEARVAAIQAQRKTATSLSTVMAAAPAEAAPAAEPEKPAEKPKKKKKKTHAEIMAELAGEAAVEEKAAAAHANADNGLEKAVAKKGGKKTHAQMMAELAAEGHFEPEPKEGAGGDSEEEDAGIHTHISAELQYSGVHSDRSNLFESFAPETKKKVEPKWKREAREAKEFEEYQALQERKAAEHVEWVKTENIRIAEEEKRARMLASRNVSVRAHLDEVRKAHAKPVVLSKVRRRAADAPPPEPELEIPEPVKKDAPPPPPFEVFRSTESGVPAVHSAKCPVCEEKVSTTGRVVKTPLGTFHNWCFKCVCCREQLKEDTYATHMDKEFCETCYNDQFELYKNKWIPIEIPEGFDV
eukprot:gene1655-30860_t